MKPGFSILMKATSGLMASLLLGISAVQASVVSPIQATADPLKLPVAGLVQLAGSDANAAAFQSALPSIKALVNSTLPEYRAISSTKLSSLAVNYSDFSLKTTSDVRIYFISEGAQNRNSLGVNYLTGLTTLPSTGTPNVSPSAELVFPDASSNDPTTYYSSGNGVRTQNAPLSAGDFVDLGQVQAGTLLDFFLIASGASGGTTALAAEATRNTDELQHAVAFVYGNYLLLSFEDAIKGGDKDYNDLVVAIEVSPIAQTPEASTWAAMLLFGGWVAMGSCRRWLRPVAAQA